jgi:hypothetical protein
VEKELSLEKVLLETDCAAMVSKLHCREMDRSLHGPLVEKVKLMLQDFAEAEVGHARRVCNGAAHCLAKVGYVNKLCQTWVGVPPGSIVDCLASDSASL